MGIHLLPLGFLPAKADLGVWLFSQLVQRAKPVAEQLFRDPTGFVTRFGDLLVWQGEKGRQVLATLESLSENQGHIRTAISGLETAQIGISNKLGAMAAFSMAGFGITAMMAAGMMARLNALREKLDIIGDQLSDLQTHADSRNQANLHSGLDFLSKYECTRSKLDLHTASEQSNLATHVYRGIIEKEIAGKQRLVALNQYGRYLVLALTAQSRCLILSGQPALAEQRIGEHKPVLAGLAKSAFDQVLGKSPEVYFDPELQVEHVTLDLLTEIYRQGSLWGAWAGPDFQSPSEVFEHFRPQIYAYRGSFRAVGKAKNTLLIRLRYLLSCLEEVTRIESLRMRLVEAVREKLSFAELEQAVRNAERELGSTGGNSEKAAVAAFAFV